MATSEQIAAAAHTVKPTTGDGFVDRKAQHILGGAYTYEQAETRRAARYMVRQAPDILPILGLDAPPRPAVILDRFADDCLNDLLRTITAAGDTGTLLADMHPVERQAARKALTARLEER